MTIDFIIKELQKSGCNSKQQVIDLLTKASDDELKELMKDIQEVLCKREMER